LELFREKKVKRNKVIILVSIILLLGMIMGCNKGDETAAPEEEPVEVVATFAVNTTTAVEGQIQDYLSLSGNVEASSTVDVYSDVAGKVSYLFGSVGKRVAKDENIIEVDPSRPGMTYVKGTVKSPVSGIIVALPAQVGMTISQAVPVARISAGNALEIKAYIAERFISRIALRQPVDISLDAYPGETFRGVISEVSPVMDPTSRTLEVKVSIGNNPQGKLKAGMFAKIRIITEQKNGIVKIPASAMINRFGEDIVFTVKSDPVDPAYQIAEQVSIVPGIVIDGVMEVQSGLNPGDEIIVRGQTLLENGSRINIVDRVQPLSAE
jgi:multidrug efflux pump subunit AcrA (membrane-fusion protein)